MKNYLLLSCIFVLLSMNVIGQNEKQQTSYIYNIVKYVDWPASYKSGDFVIGVFGSGPITAELNKLATTKKVFSQKITVVEFNSPEEISNCHVLFVTRAKTSLIKEALAKVGSNSTLIIGEFPGLANLGAAVNFVTQEGKLVFQLNEAAAKRQGLQISSQLKELSF
ncbi:MAG: YfiR family protein [Tenuifilaceae bacterium]